MQVNGRAATQGGAGVSARYKTAGLTLAAIIYALSLVWISQLGPLGRFGLFLVVPGALMFAAMLILWRLWPKGGAAWVIVLAAVVTRIVMLGFPATDDMNRYLWEGHIQHHGFNPFVTAPSSPELAHLRPDYWDGINHKDITTIYYPVAQLLFRGVTWVADTALALKILVSLFDIGIVVLLLYLVRALRLSDKNVLLYALNPLVLLLAAGEGHLESVLVFWIVASMLFMVRRRYFLMYLALGIGIMTKITPLILIPFVVRRDNARYLPAMLLPLAFSIPYLTEGISFLDVPFRFATQFHYNGLVYSIFAGMLGPTVAQFVTWSILLIALLGIFFLTPNPVRAVFNVFCAFILCTSTFHPWYLLLLTPFLAFFPSSPWLVLHLTVFFTFQINARYFQTGVWEESYIVLALEYVPFLIVALWSVFRPNQRATVRGRVSSPAISLIIPTLNEEKVIAGCIQSVQAQDARSEIIVADGGSTDQTRELVREMAGIRLIETPRGRGLQIREAVQCSSEDCIVILHADSRLKPGALAAMASELAENPRIKGGSFGAVYETPGVRFRFTQLLNSLRARLTGISFGDQAQFFRRSALSDGFPPFRLMEDIELSMRLKETGQVVFIPAGAVSSTRTWKKMGYLRNFFTVILLSSLFVVRRKLGLLTEDCGDFYGAYYGKT